MTSSGGRDGDVRVLIVEDSEDQRELLRANFQRAGCAVTVVKNAEDAISSYRADAPELAVIDLILPGMDGWQLVDQIRRDVPDCAIVVTSVLDAGKFPEATAILPKPFTKKQILDVLRECVPRWRTP